MIPLARTALGGAGQTFSKDTAMSLIYLTEHDSLLNAVLCQRLTAGAHTVMMTPDGDSCLRAMKWARPDLVIASARLPDMSSMELLEAMGESGFGQLPKILLFQATAVRDRIRVAKTGLALCLAKPVHPGQLLQAVSRSLGPNHALAA